MKRYGLVLGALVVVSAAVIAAPGSRASADVSFGVNAPVGDDGNLFFSISSRYFDRQPRMVHDWGRRFSNPDDLAVFLQISSLSHRPPEVVYDYRRQGLSWYDVGARCGLPAEVWYVPVYVQPYGHGRGPRHYNARLSDREVRDLVAVRMAHEYYGVAPEVARDWRRGGSNVQVIMTREYRSRHHDDRRYSDDRAYGRGRYSDHDSDHDRGHDSHHGKHHGKKDKKHGH